MHTDTTTTMPPGQTHHLTGIDDILGALAVLEHTRLGQFLARLLGQDASRAGR